MWQKPYRKNNAISQTFGSGVVTVYAAFDGGEPGKRPVEKLKKKVVLPYEDRRLGIQRYYSGQQNQVKIQRVIRCPDSGLINTQDIAITEDGVRYQIHMVQMAPDVFPASVDVTLAQIAQKYEKAEVMTGALV